MLLNAFAVRAQLLAAHMGDPYGQIPVAIQIFTLYAPFSLVGWLIVGVPVVLLLPVRSITRWPWLLGLALCGVDPWFGALARLKGRALAAHAAALLRERHDEDWWRNPRATVSLQGLWGRGGRPTCTELWGEMGGKPGIDPLLLEFSTQCR